MVKESMNHTLSSSAWPSVRGRLSHGRTLAELTWFQVGGHVSALFRPHDEDDLAHFLAERPQHVPLHILGAGSNVLVRDGSWQACVIKFGATFASIQREGNTLIVGAGALDRTIAQHALQEGLSGMEFLIGIPGTLGGAIAMNAGAYDHDMKGITQWVDIMHVDGRVERLTHLVMHYRHTELPAGAIVLRAALQGEPAAYEAIQQKMHTFLDAKHASQPMKGRTGGSTFKNPPGHRAWELIDAAGCRGLQWGQAQMSPLHCNFMMNLGGATAYDLENLGNLVQERVKQHTGVELEWEIQRMGTVLEEKRWVA